MPRSNSSLSLPRLNIFSILSILFASAAFVAVHAAVIGVDIGGEFLKVALVAPGRVPISIATNEISKRKTTIAVGFVNDATERVIGEAAMDFMPKSPECVVTRARDALGVDHQSSERFENVKRESKLAYATTMMMSGKKGSTGSSDLGIDFGKSGGAYRAEEMFGMTLEYAMGVGNAQGRGAIRDAVLAIPPFMSQSARRSLLDAAKIAGLNVLALKSDVSCAALQWGVDKEFKENGEPTWMVLVDIGSTSAAAALVRYSSFTGKEVGKKKQHGQFEIVDLKWDDSIGGDSLDMLLVNRFIQEFEQKHPGVDLSKTPRSVGKMRKNVRKAKEILSANTEAPFGVESWHEEIDFRTTISRETFNEIARDVFHRMAQPLRDLVQGLDRFNITLDDLEAIEVIGGSTRVPGVKDAITEAIGGRKFDVHLDADEAVAMGAGLFAANMSTTFRMRKFGALDAMPHGMSYEITPSDEFTSSEPTTLVAPFAKTPYAHRVSMFNRTSDAKIIVKLDRSNGSPLPPGTVTDQVMVVDITGVKEAMAKYNDTVGKLNVHFDFDASGILDVSKAEYIVEIIDYVPEKPKKANKSKVDANATAAADNATAAADNATDTDAEVVAPAVDTTAETEAEVEEEVPKMKMRRRVFRTPLDVAISGLPVESMTDAQIESSIQVLKNLRAKDEAKRAQEAAKSNLEAYIYAMRAKLDEDVIQEVTDEDQRSALKDLLMDKEDWLYMDGADASTEVFKKTHNELKMQGDAMEFRAKELTARPETIAAANKFIKKAKTEIASWAEKKPWLNATHVADLLEEVEQFESWLNEKVEEQNKLSKIETPTLESTEIKVSQRPVEAKFIKLKKKPKPKPIKVAKNATDANATDANVTDANATDYETEPVVEELTFDEVDETIESESWEDEQSGSDADETEEQSDDNNVKDEL